jgi:hypothetical protein
VSNRRLRKDHTDPRRPGGQIAGPGGPRERDAVVIDATDAVLFENLYVALVETELAGVRSDRMTVCMEMSGRINKTKEHSRIAYLFDEDGAAAIVTELLALANRAGFGPAFFVSIEERLSRLKADDAL